MLSKNPNKRKQDDRNSYQSSSYMKSSLNGRKVTEEVEAGGDADEAAADSGKKMPISRRRLEAGPASPS